MTNTLKDKLEIAAFVVGAIAGFVACFILPGVLLWQAGIKF